MIQVDSSLLLQIVNFLVLIALMQYFLFKPLLGIIDKRKHNLKESEEEVRRLKNAVEQKIARYEENMRSTKIAALEKNKAIIEDGAVQASKILDAARTENVALEDEIHALMEREIELAKDLLREGSQVLSGEIAAKVLGRSIQ